jgi:hypothetical protein
MELGNKEKIANHLRSQIKLKREEFKNYLLNMKGGGVIYNSWKKKYDKDIEKKQKALEHMKKIFNYLENQKGVEKTQIARRRIGGFMKELEEEIENENF